MEAIGTLAGGVAIIGQRQRHMNHALGKPSQCYVEIGELSADTRSCPGNVPADQAKTVEHPHKSVAGQHGDQGLRKPGKTIAITAAMPSGDHRLFTTA